MRFVWYAFLALFSLGTLGLIGVIGGAVYAISKHGQNLPEHSQLKDYKPPVVTRIYAGDGRLMAEFAEEKRIFIPIEAIPDLVKEAFISAEDKNFYNHKGVDYFAVARAMKSNIYNIGKGKRLVGASTITQQVAKNFLLTNEVTWDRKIKEAMLALRMERVMSKDRLLELYLNEIYLGMGSYGIAVAALNYFNKSLEELKIHEAAFLAALPKAPNNYHPVRNHDNALDRRNSIIGLMRANRYITKAQADLAKKLPLRMIKRDSENIVHAPYFAEEVRRELVKNYGTESLYGGGLAVRTSIDPRLQEIAERTLKEGLIAYDKRHGWRGALDNFDTLDDWAARLEAYKAPAGMPDSWNLVIVMQTSHEEAVIAFPDKTRDKIMLKYLSWAREHLESGEHGADVKSVRDVLHSGDIIMVERVEVNGEQVYGLRQIPAVDGAIIALDPHTGRILAMQGGWSYKRSEFNRANQAWRQPGSAFKPFVYIAALDKGFTPATLVLDAPFVIDQGHGLGKWRPANYTKEFYGPTPIRVGIEKSRNLMTVRLADFVGMDSIVEYARKFGVVDHMAPLLANALGSGESTLLRMTTGYAQFVNGGKRIIPTFIDRIQDRRGRTVFNHDTRPCNGCGSLVQWNGQETPEIPDIREQIADPRKTYQVVSMLEGVVQRGTGIRIRALGRPIAGKTGTTNESRDAWFIGFSPDLAVGVFIGFDEPRTLGKNETGSSVAVPVFRDFMKEALADRQATPFRVPAGIRHVQINAKTGARARLQDENVIWESFLVGTEPTDKMYILDGKGISLMPTLTGTTTDSASTGTGGLY